MHAPKLILLVTAPLLSAVPAADTDPVAPPARRDALVETLHGVSVPDPYRWMEDIDSPETRAWIEGQAAYAEKYLSGIPQRKTFLDRLRELQDYDKNGLPRKVAGRLFYARKSGLQNQAVVYWKEDKPDAPEHVLIDPNGFREDGTIALTGWDITEDGTRIAYSVSEAGSDWETLRVRDVDSAKDRDDLVEWVKFSGPSWSRDGRGFYYSRFAEPEKGSEFKAENYDQKVYFHKLGDPQEKDVLVYARPDHPKWGLNAGETEDGRYLAIYVSEGTRTENNFFYRDLSAGPDAPVVELLAGFSAEWRFLGNIGTEFRFLTTSDAPNRRIVAIDVAAASPLESLREIVPAGDSVIDSASLTGGRLIVQRLVDAHDEVTVYDPDGKALKTLALPNFGSSGGFGGRMDDRETFYAVSGYDTPGTLYRLDLASLESSVYLETKVPFDIGSIAVEQRFFPSKDGTKIPLYLVRRRDITPNGERPVMLSGYGGFDISVTPSFSANRIAWIEAGGIFAQVILRGGGEYGQPWHEAGMKDRKQNVFDDFIAASEYLIRENWTRPSRLAISGGSNGGLLVAACMIQRPELFGCVLPAVGVHDMLRFHKFTIGWAWQSEYGSPDSPADFPYLFAYSPLHNARPNQYPATMVLTADHDDRVFPAHSFKFAAALQHAQTGPAPILLRVDLRAGHGAGKPTLKQLEETADIYAFAWKSLGMDQ